MKSALELGYLQLGISAALVVLSGLLSLILRLELIKSIAVASLRTVIQLSLVGYVLKYVFELSSLWVVLLCMSVMILAAARAAWKRSNYRYPKGGIHTFISLALTGIITTFWVTQMVVQVEPWYSPQYAIPLLGMILGNSLTGVSLGLDHLLESLKVKRDQVELSLAFGATRWQAFRPCLKAALRRAMVPILNSMTVVGLVSLPGMMTGQILQGADPTQAVRYQIVVMFTLCGSTALASIICCWLAGWMLFNQQHQLLSQRILGGEND